jgi:hypothetical protein
MASQISLEEMHQRHYALTQPIADGYQQAAAVCLQRHHKSPQEMTLSDNGSLSVAEIVWDEPTHQIVAAWANVTDTTEAGAYGCVIAAVELLRNLYAVRRAETGTGADYYVAPKGTGLEDLENCLRLEISGVSDGNTRDVEGRLLQKVAQAQRGNSSLPAVAGVVGFAARLVMVKDVPEVA